MTAQHLRLSVSATFKKSRLKAGQREQLFEAFQPGEELQTRRKNRRKTESSRSATPPSHSLKQAVSCMRQSTA